MTARGALLPTIVFAILVAPIARAQFDDEPQENSASETVSIGVSSAGPGRGDSHRDVIIVQPNESGRRDVPFTVSLGTSERLAMDDADIAMAEIEPLYGAQEAQYIAWVHGTIDVDAERIRPSALRLKVLESKLEITCPKEVEAGSPIAVKVKGAGNANIQWRASLIYPCDTDATGDELYNRHTFLPDNGQYEIHSMDMGKAVEGVDPKIVRFNTYAADRGSHLGVRVENPTHIEDGLTFWVKVR